jgi:uncharacterized protein
MKPTAAQHAMEPRMIADLDVVREIVLCRLAGYNARVYLFGSRARGDARAGSDIDVAVLPLDPLDPLVLADIRDALDECSVPYAVDVVDLTTASDELRHRALGEGIEWTAHPSA